MKIWIVFIFLFFSRSFSWGAEDFIKFDSIVFSEKNSEVLKQYSRNELKKYQSTQNKYFLYNSKYIDALIAGNGNKNNERLKLLSWIIEDGNDKHTEQITIVYYHLASMLSIMNSPKISQEYAFKALNNSIKFKYNDHLLYTIYGLIGTNYYKERQYKKASFYYKKSLHLIEKDQNIGTASMLNNISLCLMNMDENEEAKSYYIKSIKILKKVKNKSEFELNFLKIVEGNLGTVLDKLGNYDEAIVLLEKEIEYGFLNEKYLDESIPPVIELLKLYDKLNRKTELDRILSKAIYLENKFGENGGLPIITEALYIYYLSKNDAKNALKYSNHLLKYQKKYTQAIIKQSSELNEIIYRDKLHHLNEDKKSQDKLLLSAVKEKRSTQFLFFTIISLGSLIGYIGYRSKKKNRMKDSLIQEQNKLLLENENKLQQEKITNLAINLTLKKNTEKAFLSKINELKKKNNVGVEQVIKELQFSVSNLLNIDKKLIHSTIEADDIHQDFKISIAKLHPELTKTDITFCCYFRLNLSAKEISALQGVSDGSVRVIKNRIKNKLNLLPEDSISDYLIHI